MSLEADTCGSSVNKNVLGWTPFFLQLTVATVAYCTAAHIFAPVQHMESMKTAAGEFLSVIVVYLGMFTVMYSSVLAVTFVILVLIRKSNIHITNVLAKAILPSLIVGAISIFGGWYSAAHAGDLSYTTRKDLKDGIKLSCIKTQKADSNNKQFPLVADSEYCDCSATVISQKITSSEFDYFQANETWPKGFMDRNHEEGLSVWNI